MKHYIITSITELQLTIMTSTNEVVFSDFCLLVCDQDYTKTTEQISANLGCRMGLSPEQSPLTFGADQEEQYVFPHILFHCEGFFSNFFCLSPSSIVIELKGTAESRRRCVL